MINHSRLNGVPYWRLSGFYFLFFVTVGIYLPYWSLYLKSIHFNAEQIGIISAIVVGTKIFSSYLWGWIVDHTAQRMRVIQIASLFTALSFIAVLFIKDFWALAFIIFLFAIFWSASLPQVEAATLSSLGESSHAYTIIRLWGSVGFIAIVWGLGIVFESISISYVPLILLISLVLVWLLTLSIPEIPAEHHDDSHGSLKIILSKPKVIALLLACFLMLVSHGPYYTFYSIYLEDYGYSRSFIGQMWALGVIAEVVLFLFMHRLIVVFGLRKLLLLSLLSATIRWLLIAYFVDHLVLLGIAQLLHAATFGICHAVAIQYVHKYFRGKLQGRGQALYSSTSFGAGFAIGSLLTGYGWESLGATTCFTIASVSAFLAMIIAWVFVKD
ncbi:MAG: MFS transporter [Gammaproteobacteria bacterium]|nr:MFS transporter [Gammaproteobacteria bacterium]